ncbi:MAG: tetratricopeptide repeat protein [Phycisphaerae bacterium]
MPADASFLNAVFALLDRGDEAGATRLVEARLSHDPGDPDANMTRAMIHGAHERFNEAAACLRLALVRVPDDPEAQMMLGNVMVALKGYEEGAKAFASYLRACPTDAGAVMGLGQCLISLGRTEEAAAAMERGIEASPDDANMYGYMASVLVAIGQVARAMAIVKRGYARLPHATGLLSFIVQNSNFLEGVDPVEHRDLHRRLCDAWAAHAARPPARLENTLDPSRTLRVGFLSGDFKLHACAFFMRSLIPLLDRRSLSVFCYSTAAAEDAVTSIFKSGATWRPVSHLDDASLAATIRADRIDVLIDCSGHFDGNRLPALQPRVAPVQCTWLGYPNTTGLATMDWRIVDAVTDPPEHDPHLSERAARLPACFICYTPPKDAPEVSVRSPDEPIVFGSFNRLDKVTESTLDAWCRVLRAVPGSRMAIKSRMMTGELQDLAKARFTSRGIEASRIVASDYVPDTRSHLSLYQGIDIALDAFPYNGTTTTCEASWMGVPVVTLLGNVHRARVGASINTAVGVTELIAKNVDDYVTIASSLAQDRPRLTALRSSLRSRMAASPLCNAPRYARDFEALLRDLWRQHVASARSGAR